MMKRIAFLFILLLSVQCAGISAQELLKEKPSAVRGRDVVAEAMQYLGTPYRYGKMSPKYGFDCSGFTSYVFKGLNLDLPRVSRMQYDKETAIADSKDLHKGDLVFFSGRKVSKRIGHVGIVTQVNHQTGEFSFIHASCSEGVTVSSSTDAYYAKRYIGACRVLPDALNGKA